jgi:hypothetical protein
LGRAEYIGDSQTYDESAVQDAVVEQIPHSSLSEDDIKVLQIRKAFDIPPRAIAESLIATFLDRCKPWMPLIEEDAMYQFLRTGTKGEGAPLLLMHAVFMAGCRVHPRMCESSLIYYNRAKVLFSIGFEKNPISLIIAVCFLQWWNPTGPEMVSIHSSSYWLRVGVGLAQQIGLHREPDPRKHSDWKLRRRMWWTLYVIHSYLS